MLKVFYFEDFGLFQLGMALLEDEYLQTRHDNIYKSKDECNIQLWYPRIKQHAVTTYILPLTIEDIEALVTFGQYFRNCIDALEPDKYGIIERNFTILENYDHKWGEYVSWTKLNSFQEYKHKLKMIQYKLNTFMSKFSSLRSSKKRIAFIPRLSIDMKIPTDSLYRSSKIYQCLLQDCLRNNDYNKSQTSMLWKYYDICWEMMQFENGTDIIELFIRSEYMLNELNAAHIRISESNDDINCSLILQMIPFNDITDILQFRMFICSDNPVAITQYQYFINYKNINMESFILPISSSMSNRWVRLLLLSDDEDSDFKHSEHDSDNLSDKILNVLIAKYEEIKTRLKFKKCKNYYIDFILIDEKDEYNINVIGINREPLYNYQYGLLDYYQDIQSKQVGLMFGKDIANVCVKLSVKTDHDDEIKVELDINNILSETTIQFLYLNGLIQVNDIQQLFNKVIWKYPIINKIVNKIYHTTDKCVNIMKQCWMFIHDIGGFGGKEIVYMICGGFITLWIQYIVNDISLLITCTFALDTILMNVALPSILLLMFIWFVIGFLLSLLFLIYHN